MLDSAVQGRRWRERVRLQALGEARRPSERRCVARGRRCIFHAAAANAERGQSCAQWITCEGWEGQGRHLLALWLFVSRKEPPQPRRKAVERPQHLRGDGCGAGRAQR